MKKESRGGKTNQISQAIQFLPHQATLAPPPRHLPVHEVEEEPRGDEGQGDVDVRVCIGGAETVAQRGEDGHEAAEPLGQDQLRFRIVVVVSCRQRRRRRGEGSGIPFISVMRSARWRALIMEKWPAFWARSIFCFSSPVEVNDCSR